MKENGYFTLHFQKMITKLYANFFFFGPFRSWLKKNKVQHMMLVLPLTMLRLLTVLLNVLLNLIVLWTSGNAKIR